MNKIFFDANILLDILLPSRPNHAKAVAAYETICQTGAQLATSENILTTIEYIAVKNGTDCRTISRFFTGLQEVFALYGFADVLTESLGIYETACRQGEKIDFEDLLQLQCAIHNGCDVFLTEDGGILNGDHEIEVIGLDSIGHRQQ